MLRRSDTIWIADTETDLAGVVGPRGTFCFIADQNATQLSDGDMWMPSARDIVRTSETVVDGKTVGNYKLLTLPPTALYFRPILIVPRAVGITGTTITPPSVSIGTNPTTYNNISAAGLLSTVLSTLGAGVGAPTTVPLSPAIPGGTDIYARVNTAAVATTYTVAYDIVGYYAQR